MMSGFATIVLLLSTWMTSCLASHHHHHHTSILRLPPPRTTTTTTTTTPKPRSEHDLILDSIWDDFKNNFNKTYSRRSEPLRRLAWEENLLKVHLHNEEAARGQHNYTLRENHMADMTENDYLREMVRLVQSRRRRCEDSDILMMASPDSIPDEVDWRKKGFITPPMNQKNCGACYAFSISTMVEAQVYKTTGQLVHLSEQQIVDCSYETGNLGCQGGSVKNTMRYIKKNGLMLDNVYPYTNKQTLCKYRATSKIITISDWRLLPPRDEEALKVAVAQIGPVVVSINASPHTFMLYHNGVYHDKDCTSDKVNHAMLLVGYNKESWILKNWWSEHWGVNGYMYLSRGQNLCGVANFAAYAIL